MRVRAAVLALGLVCARVSWAQTAEPPLPPDASASSASAAPGETSFLVENVTRAEAWRYFQPPPDGGTHPDYAFVGSRFTLGARYRGPRWSADGALQYVRLENLPRGSIGPGFLGNGGAYYFHANGRFSYQFYLRRLTLGWKAASSGVWIEAGRFSRAAETEPPSGNASIDRIVATELNGRLLGDAEWSFYQRAWDGVRGGFRRGAVSVTATAATPTQGTFEESANLPMDRLRVGAVEATIAPGGLARHTRVEMFSILYDDRRQVRGRFPDNTFRTAMVTPGVDVRVVTGGGSLVGAYPSRAGITDVTLWVAGQAGDWFGQDHRAVAATATVGQQFPTWPWRPWLRAGTIRASGDGDGMDGRHGTFFPLLPSSERLSRLNAYALMNVVDHWISVDLAPTRPVSLSVGLHRVGMASSTDRWYQGSGASLRTGGYVGFQTRYTFGSSRLGTILDGSATWRATRWWTLRGYIGRMAGGDVVWRNFADQRLVSGWLESTVRF